MSGCESRFTETARNKSPLIEKTNASGSSRCRVRSDAGILEAAMRSKVSRIALSLVALLAFAVMSSAQSSGRHEGGVLACAYVDMDLLVPSHALHYLNAGPLEVNVELDRPDDSVDPHSERAACSRDDKWDVESAFGRSVLHAWVCLGNPNSMFSELTPLAD
jgi:hypothetical protein